MSYHAAHKQRILFEQVSEFAGRLACGLAALHDSSESFETVRTNLMLSNMAGNDAERCVDMILRELGFHSYRHLEAIIALAKLALASF